MLNKTIWYRAAAGKEASEMIDSAGRSEIGEKEQNEDAFRICSEGKHGSHAFVLADGLGAYGNGELAADYVCDFVEQALKLTDYADADFVEDCFEYAQSMLMLEKTFLNMPAVKTTMVLLFIRDGLASWGHIGDSRLYHFRDGRILSRTVDHSVPQMLASSGSIREEEIRHHPDRNLLLRAMGSDWERPEYEIDKREVPVLPGDWFLFCSDGFWDWIDEEDMLRILKQGGDAHSLLNKMMEEVRKAGSGNNMDNYTAILVNIKDGSELFWQQ